MEDINTRYDQLFLVFNDENAEVEQYDDLIVNYNTNYYYTESNDLTEHQDSVVMSVQQRWIELCNVEEHNWLKNALMNSF